MAAFGYTPKLLRILYHNHPRNATVKAKKIAKIANKKGKYRAFGSCSVDFRYPQLYKTCILYSWHYIGNNWQMGYSFGGYVETEVVSIFS